MVDAEKECKEMLTAFPSSFETNNIVQNANKEVLQRIIYRLESERDQNGSDSPLEEVRDINLLSFLYYSIGQHDRALAFSDTALKHYEININTLTCRAWIHLYRLELSKCIPICEQLGQLKTDKLKMLVAKAEVGYAYSRFGIDNYPRAEAIFEEVLEEIRRDPGTAVPLNYICAWKFGLALVKKRQLNITNLQQENIESGVLRTYEEQLNKTMKIFLDIANIEGENIENLKARSYVYIGQLLSVHRKDPAIFEKHIFSKLEGWNVDKKSSNCFYKGYRLKPDDVIVLEQYARHLRMRKETDRSIDICRQALQIRERSTTHHYLALSMKSKLEYPNCPKPPRRTRHGVNVKQTPKTKNTFSVTLPCETSNHQSTNRNRKHTDSRAHNCKQDPLYASTEHCSKKGHGKTTAEETYTVQQKHVDEKFKSMALHNTPKKPPNCGDSHVQSKTIAFSKLIKCPKDMKALPPDKIKDILYHLDRAVELSENIAALYDKGLVLRAAGRPEEALEVFKSLYSHPRCSLCYLANAYEQSAHCVQDIACKLGAYTQTHQVDTKTYLKKSLEVECKLFREQPNLKYCWSSYPTLQSFLEINPKPKHWIREMADFQQKVQNYREAVNWFKQVLDMETDPEAKAKTHMNIIRNSLQAEDYDEAILHFDMMMCFPDGTSTIDEALSYKVHIEGGIKAFETGEKDIASLRVRNALNLKRSDKDSGQQVDDGRGDSMSTWFDVYVLCDDDQEHIGRTILEYLRDLGIRATYNDDENFGNKPVFRCRTGILETSTHVVVIPGKDTRLDDIYPDIIIHTHREHGFGNTVVVQESDDLKLAKVFRGFPCVTYTNIKNRSDMKIILYMLSSGRTDGWTE